MSDNRFIYTIGIDVGGSVIKAVLTEYIEGDDGVARTRDVSRRMEKIRKRNPVPVADDLIRAVADDYGIGLDGVAYIASTGEG